MVVELALEEVELPVVEGFARLSVTMTREFVEVVVGVVVVVVVFVVGVVCAAATAYENSTKPASIARLESLLSDISYLFYWNAGRTEARPFEKVARFVPSL